MRRLLAKSAPAPGEPGRGVTLPAHTQEVMVAAEALVDAAGAATLQAAGLPATELPALRRIVLAAAWGHDLGKCSEHFQAMVRGERSGQAQLVRHEALSGLLLLGPLADWFRAAMPDAVERACVVAAIVGHHRKFPDDALAPSGAGAGASVLAHTDHADLTRTLTLATRRLGWPPPPTLTPQRYSAVARPTLLAKLDALIEQVTHDARGAALGPLARGLTLAADVAGSALPREGAFAGPWISETFSRRPDAEAISRLVDARLQGQPPRPFQEAVAACAGPIALVRAGCGSGKTAAAYLWARQHAGRQLWFAYPTTGTATEGFRDYLMDADLDAALEHSRRDVDLELLTTPEDEADRSRSGDRLEALRIWGREAVACTVDTPLGLLCHQRKGAYGMPALMGAAMVFDEVHAYDDRLFGVLLRWLRAFPGLPALLMTASLPKHRIERLRALCREVHGQALAELPGPESLERLPRYRRDPVEDPFQRLVETSAAGGKTLWVCNTVDRCREAAARAEALCVPALVYHSRFRYLDRVSRHKDVIDAFRAEGPCAAFTTQVAEMSLDLSADLLVSELAPIPALIQRLGRLNRRATPERPIAPRPFVLIEPSAPLPYDEDALERALRWAARLPDRALSQSDLAEAWRAEDEDEGEGDALERAPWLDEPVRAAPEALREGGIGLTVLLARDAAEVRAGRLSVVAASLPMNLPGWARAAWRRWPTLGYLPVVPEGLIHYDHQRGATWREPAQT